MNAPHSFASRIGPVAKRFLNGSAPKNRRTTCNFTGDITICPFNPKLARLQLEDKTVTYEQDTEFLDVDSVSEK